MGVVRSTAKGKIMIPAEIGRKSDIQEGSSLNIDADKERSHLEPLLDDPVQHDKGMLKTGGRVLSALLEERRRDRGTED